MHCMELYAIQVRRHGGGGGGAISPLFRVFFFLLSAQRSVMYFDNVLIRSPIDHSPN